MKKITVNWHRDLRNPTEPGEYRIEGLGLVTVRQNEIEAALAHRGNPDVEIEEIISQGHSGKRRFILGYFIPEQKNNDILNFIKRV